jgi:hypothetical protein
VDWAAPAGRVQVKIVPSEAAGAMSKCMAEAAGDGAVPGSRRILLTGLKLTPHSEGLADGWAFLFCGNYLDM